MFLAEIELYHFVLIFVSLVPPSYPPLSLSRAPPLLSW